MTDIEELVRRALAETPAATTSTDPLAALDRRVRRARRRLAAAAGAVAAAVAAAIVVPLAVVGGGHDASKVSVYHPPTPKPSAPAGTSVLWPNGAISVSSDSDGRQWLLFNNGTDSFVGRVGDNTVHEAFKVQAPADYVVAGDNMIWVIGEGPGGGAPSRVTALDTRTGTVSTATFQADLSLAVAVNESLYVDALQSSSGQPSVDRMAVRNGTVMLVASVPVPAAGLIARSQQGHVWVQSSAGLVELIPTPDGLNKGATVQWGTDVYGPTGADSTGDDLWAYDGDRIIGLTPKNLLAGVSVAEGWRLDVGGRPSAVATAGDGSLFAAVPQQGIYYYSPQTIQGGASSPDAELPGATAVASLVGDPAGGVDYVDDQGQLLRWDPTSAGAAR